MKLGFMFEAKFKLKHKGCWTCGLTKFKSNFYTHITLSVENDSIQDVVEITISPKDSISEIKKYFENQKIISKWRIIEETNEKLMLQIFTDTTKIKSVVRSIVKNNCFVSKKIIIKDEYEIWTIAACKKEHIKNAIEQISKMGDFKILYVKKSTFDGLNISKKQEYVLKTAIDLGYYCWPRKISAEKLAHKLKLNKSTVIEHLRKAENKMMIRNFGE